MKKFVIFSSETVSYFTEVEAENEEAAEQKFWDMNHNDDTLQMINSSEWQIDKVTEEVL